MQSHVYYAHTPDGTPAINVYAWKRADIENMIADRKANGEAFEGETYTRALVSEYRGILLHHGMYVPMELRS